MYVSDRTQSIGWSAVRRRIQQNVRKFGTSALEIDELSLDDTRPTSFTDSGYNSAMVINLRDVESVLGGGERKTPSLGGFLKVSHKLAIRVSQGEEFSLAKRILDGLSLDLSSVVSVYVHGAALTSVELARIISQKTKTITFEKVYSRDGITFSDLLHLVADCTYITLDVENVKYANDPAADLATWASKRRQRLINLSLRNLPAINIRDFELLKTFFSSIISTALQTLNFAFRVSNFENLSSIWIFRLISTLRGLNVASFDFDACKSRNLINLTISKYPKMLAHISEYDLFGARFPVFPMLTLR